MFNLIMLINLKARSIWLTHDPLFQSIGNIYITASFGVPHVRDGEQGAADAAVVSGYATGRLVKAKQQIWCALGGSCHPPFLGLPAPALSSRASTAVLPVPTGL